MPRIIAGEVGFAAITHRVRVCDEDRGLYAIALTTDEWFFSDAPPTLFAKDRQPLPLQHIPVGSWVKIRLDDGNWMQAVQLLKTADDCPF